MVFSKLSVQERDAFFGLLDEYFQSRPELFGRNGNSQGISGLAGTGVSTTAATSIVQHALAASNTAGSSNGGIGGASGSRSNNPYTANMVPSHVDVAHAVTVGRVAAASLAFSGGGLSQPPSLPRRAPSITSTSASLERALSPGSEVDKLVTKKTSVFSAFKKPEASAGVVIPPAFAPSKNTFGPPPVRHVTSETSSSVSTGSGGGGGGGVGMSAQRIVMPVPTPKPASEMAEGEWAEALYDYSSEDPGDLTIQAGSRVFVTDKSSDDWWTGQVEGQERQGLFPASYVKLL